MSTSSGSSGADRAATPSPLLRHSEPIGRSTPQFQTHRLASLGGGRYDGNNNQGQRSPKKRRQQKRVTYDIDEIDRNSSSTFAPGGREDGRRINIIVNNLSQKEDEEEEEDDGPALPKKTAVVSANEKHIFTNVVLNNEKDQVAETEGSASPQRSFSDTHVSILQHDRMFTKCNDMPILPRLISNHNYAFYHLFGRLPGMD